MMPKNFSPIKLKRSPKKSSNFFGLRIGVVLVTMLVGAYLVNQFVYRSKAAADIATVTFVPRLHSVTKGETFTQSLQISAGEKKLSGANLVLEYNPEYLEYLPQPATQMLGTTLPANYFTARLIEEATSSGNLGQVRVALVALKPDSELGSSVVIPLSFRAKKSTNSKQTLVLNEPRCEIVGLTGVDSNHTFEIDSAAATAKYTIGGAISCSNDSECGANANCSAQSSCLCKNNFYNCDNAWENGCEATSACVASGSVSLKLSLKLQGINHTPSATNKIKVKLKLTNGSSKQELSEVELISSSENNGVFSATVDFKQITPGPGFNLFVKAPKHIQKRYCVATPSGGITYRCSKDEQIIITDGLNTLDLTGAPLLSGDLPLPQDGILNSRDVVGLKNCIGKTDATCKNNGDLNYDGAVNGNDFSLLVESMGIKYDDEN